MPTGIWPRAPSYDAAPIVLVADDFSDSGTLSEHAFDINVFASTWEPMEGSTLTDVEIVGGALVGRPNTAVRVSTQTVGTVIDLQLALGSNDQMRVYLDYENDANNTYLTISNRTSDGHLELSLNERRDDSVTNSWGIVHSGEDFIGDLPLVDPDEIVSLQIRRGPEFVLASIRTGAGERGLSGAPSIQPAQCLGFRFGSGGGLREMSVRTQYDVNRFGGIGLVGALTTTGIEATEVAGTKRAEPIRQYPSEPGGIDLGFMNVFYVPGSDTISIAGVESWRVPGERWDGAYTAVTDDLGETISFPNLGVVTDPNGDDSPYFRRGFAPAAGIVDATVDDPVFLLGRNAARDPVTMVPMRGVSIWSTPDHRESEFLKLAVSSPENESAHEADYNWFGTEGDAAYNRHLEANGIARLYDGRIIIFARSGQLDEIRDGWAWTSETSDPTSEYSPAHASPFIPFEHPDDQDYVYRLVPWNGLYLNPTIHFVAQPGGPIDETGSGRMRVSWDGVSTGVIHSNWIPRSPGIGVDWDGGFIIPAHLPGDRGPLRDEDTWRFHYTAWSDVHGSTTGVTTSRGSGMSYIEYEYGRFVQVTGDGGVLTSVVVQGPRLLINASENDGEIRISLVNPATGEPVPGFDASSMDRFPSGNLYDTPVTWRGREMPDQPVQVRFEFDGDAALYAWSVLG